MTVAWDGEKPTYPSYQKMADHHQWLPEDSNYETLAELYRSTIASRRYWDEVRVRFAIRCC